MAFEGLLQWTDAVVTLSTRVSASRDRLSVDLRSSNLVARHQAILNFHSECHFFAIAANKLIQYQKWVLTFGLCATVDFSEIDRFSKDIRALRNMREHIIDYFQGSGRDPAQWVVAGADASSVSGTMIGGRLDWIKCGAAAERLLQTLLVEPIPYPPR